MERLSKTGVRILDANEPLPWAVEAGVVEQGSKPIVSLVRFRIFGKSDPNQESILLVYNAADTTGNRPAAYGVPGGTVEGKETPREALEHEKGEIPFAICGDPAFAYQYDVERSDRTERIVVFDVEVDENQPVAISDEEGQEVSKARFFTFEEALALPVIDTREGVPRQDHEGIYHSHGKLVESWRWMRRLGVRSPAEAFDAVARQKAASGR